MHHRGVRTFGVPFLVLVSSLITPSARAAVTISADGPGETYELLQARGFGLELPDCGHNVRHIREVFDSTLNRYTFAMDIHRDLDDDRCNGSTDRQRNEVKTAPGSANQSLFQCGNGQTCHYRWKFKVDAGLKPSPNFFHIFQIKAASGGDEGSPLITITPRYGSPEIMQIIYTAGSGGSGSGVKASANLSLFKGVWVEALVTHRASDSGMCSVSLRRLSDGANLLSWSGNVDMWRSNNSYNRGKWGLYRSINSISYLRDETMLINDWCVSETSAGDCPSAIGNNPTPTPTPTVVPPTPTPTPTGVPPVTPTPTPTNPTGGDVEITPGAAAVSASTNDGNVPANTVDGSLATRWSGNGDGAWIQYDLGTEQAISYVKIAVYNGNGRQNRFDLQVGDGTSWTNVITSGLTSGTTTQLVTYDFPDQVARFVRYVGHMSNVGTFNSLTEVEIWRNTAVPVTPTPTATPPVGPVLITLEAESAALTSPMQTGADGMASGGAYITVAAGNNSGASAPSSGHAVFTFDVPVSGTYKVWGRVIAPADTDDSFWVRMDGASWTNWNNIPLGSAWHWDDVHDGAAGNALKTYSLPAGTHMLTIAYREDGARLDKVIVTNDLAYVPSGM